METRLLNFAKSIAIAVSFYSIVILLSDDVNAFGSFSQRRFVSHFQSNTNRQIAFLVCRQTSHSRELSFLSSTSSDNDDEIDSEEEGDDEYEYVYEYEEEHVEEDEEKENDEMYAVELQDDLDDPNYMAQKVLIEASVKRRDSFNKFRDMISGEDFIKDNIGEFLDEQLEEAGVSTVEVDEIFKEMEVTEDEAEEAMAEENEKLAIMSDIDKKEAILKNLGSDSEVFPIDGDPILSSDNERYNMVTEDLQQLQKKLEDFVGTMRGYDDSSLIKNKLWTISTDDFSKLDEETKAEIDLCLEGTATDADGDEYGESIKLEEPLRWLLYDLNFNVTNLIFASCKHNPDAPLILNQWMPQLCTYNRYAAVREHNFRFTWDDCKDVDMDELLRYYKGLGHDEIPSFTPNETNIVQVDTEVDEDVRKAAAVEAWIDEIYLDEEEEVYFDDEEFQPEDNIYDPSFKLDEEESKKPFFEEYGEFNKKYENATKEWKEIYVQETNYTVENDEEANREYRGCLVVACTSSNEDLDLAERLTLRIRDEYGKKVHVETRVLAHARESDKVLEIWMESYDIELIHSKRRSTYDPDVWEGPGEVDDVQFEYLIDKVGYLISDDARYSYQLYEFEENA